MIELCYNSYAIAYYIVSMELGGKEQMVFLENMYHDEYAFLPPMYKKDKKKFISGVLFWTNYLVDYETLDTEFPVIEKDFRATGREFEKSDMLSEYSGVDLFFMMLRLRLKYNEEKDYIRMKLRTLLKHYGYKRRSDAIVSHIRDCMMFYHIQSYLKGEQECDIKDIELDDMISFRII